MRPRIRTIKPETWQDEGIGDLSHGARLLWVGLITMADDEGRLRELPTAINGHIFPYDQVTPGRLHKWLSEVEKTGTITRYEVDGKRFIAFRHWTRHQKVDRPRDSELPPPPSTNHRRSSHEPFDDDSRSPRTRASRSDPDPGRSSSDSSDVEVSENQAEREIFDYWRERCTHPDAKFTAERRAKVRSRRREGYTDDQIQQAIDGAARAPFVNSDGKRFDDLELICRTGSKLESFIGRTKSTGADAAGLSALDARRLASAQRLMKQRVAAPAEAS